MRVRVRVLGEGVGEGEGKGEGQCADAGADAKAGAGADAKADAGAGEGAGAMIVRVNMHMCIYSMYYICIRRHMHTRSLSLSRQTNRRSRPCLQSLNEVQPSTRLPPLPSSSRPTCGKHPQ